MGPGSPFPDDINEADIESAYQLEHLHTSRVRSRVQKSGCETWSCAWAPDASYVAWSSGHRIVKLIPWNRYKNTTLQHNNEDSNGRILTHQVITIDAGELVWSVAFGSRRADTKPHSTNLYRYHAAVRDLLLATGLQNGRIRIWQVHTGQLMLDLLDHRDVIRDLKFAPDESIRLLSASRDGTLKVWDLDDDGNMSHTLRVGTRWVYACAWSPDAKLVCSVGHSKTVFLWDMTNYEIAFRLDGHCHNVCGCDFSPDGALLATASYDTQVIIWDPYTGEKLLRLGHMFPTPSPIFAGGSNGAFVRAVSFSHDGRHVATVSEDTYLRFWDIFDPYVPAQVAEVNTGLCAAYSPDGNALAVGTRDGDLFLWLTPMKVSDLQQLCRIAIRRLLPSTSIQSLQLPHKLKTFLMYRE